MLAVQYQALKVLPSRCLVLGQLAKRVEKTLSLNQRPGGAQIPIWNINARFMAGFQEKNRCVFQRQKMKKPLQIIDLQGFPFLAEWTGLEPATPGVTGRYSNQLNYHSWQCDVSPGGCCNLAKCHKTWRPYGDSNPGTHRERVMS